MTGGLYPNTIHFLSFIVIHSSIERHRNVGGKLMFSLTLPCIAAEIEQLCWEAWSICKKKSLVSSGADSIVHRGTFPDFYKWLGTGALN